MKGVIKVKKKKEADLGKDSLGPLLLKLALPAILAQIINVLYNMVDRMYIGHIPKVGPSALTGVGVTMPVIMAISAVSYTHLDVYKRQIYRSHFSWNNVISNLIDSF